MDGYCLDAHNNWSFYNGSELMYSESMKTTCSKIEDVCCHEISISSANSEVKNGNESFYDEQPKESLGIYKSIGMNNGRYVYQKKNEDRFLEYGEKYWLLSTGIGKRSGHIHHHGGSVCPEHIEKEWQISDKNKDGRMGWKDDPDLKIMCVEPLKDSRLKHASHNDGPIAQPYVHVEPVTQASNYSGGAIVFGCISMLLISMMILFFARRFHRAWGRGAKGKQLMFETLDVE